MLDLVRRESLSDSLARAVMQMIDREGFQPGDRLPTIADMAQSFGVGHPTLREALQKLQAVGAVRIKHGSGIYVEKSEASLFISNPVVAPTPSQKVMLDLIEVRLAVETLSAGRAAEQVTDAQLATLEALLDEAANCLEKEDDVRLSEVNMSFHREIAQASGNTVLHQILDVLAGLFRQEQYVILNIYGSRQQDYEGHREIFEALKQRDTALAEARMKAHLEGVRDVLQQWDPQDTPVS